MLAGALGTVSGGRRGALGGATLGLMLVVDTITVRPYETGDDAFVAALADEAFSEYTPGAVSHTLAMVRRYTTLVALEPVRAPMRSPARGSLWIVRSGKVMRAEPVTRRTGPSSETRAVR